MTTPSSSVLKKLLIVFLVFAGLHFGKEFLMPLVIGTVLATLFLSFCKWMEAKKIPKVIAVTICLFTFLMAVAAVGAMIGWQVSELSNDAAAIKQKSIETAAKVQQYIFTHLGISAEKQSQMLKEQQASIGSMISMVAGSLSYMFTNFILVLVYMFLLLYFRGHIKNFLLKLSPASQRNEMKEVINSAANVSQQYMVGLAKMVVCLWIMFSIGFSIVGVEHFFFFAILCGLLEIVPYIGNLIGTGITILVSAVQGADSSMLLGILITYGTVQFIQTWMIEPLVVGPQVKINPFATVVALVLGEIVWGVPGVILAIPIAGIFKIVCDHITELKPYGFLIGEISEPKREPRFVTRLKGWVKTKLHLKRA